MKIPVSKSTKDAIARSVRRSELNEAAAAQAIETERKRQIEVEGWDAAHDDAHTDGSLLRAAVIYYQFAKDPEALAMANGIPLGWPWEREWWKPKGKIRNLIKGGALCLAERDRLRRAAPKMGGNWWPPHVKHKFDLIVALLEAESAAAVSHG